MLKQEVTSTLTTRMSAAKGEAINRGKEYEIVVPAYLALKLLQDENVIDFTFELNLSGCKKFDDLSLHVTYKAGNTEFFLLQLKHKEPQNEILDANVSLVNGRKKDFIIRQYAKAYNCMDDDIRSGITCVLFTNATFVGLENLSNFEAVPVGNHFSSNIFQTDHIYQFKQVDEPQQSFFQRFFLFSGQRNLLQMQEETLQMLQEMFSSNQDGVTCYIDFFRRVHFENYEDNQITRSTVVLQLTNLFLGKHVTRTQLNGAPDVKIQLIEKAMQHFDLVFVRNFDLNFIENRWSFEPGELHSLQEVAKCHKLLPKDANFDGDVLLISCNYFDEKLLFVEVNEESRQALQLLANLWRSTEFKIKLGLLGAITEGDFPECKIFNNVAELRNHEDTYDAILNSFEISLQGREAVSLNTLATNFHIPIDELITPDQLFQMLNGCLVVGNKMPSLPEPYIPRTLLRTDFNYNILKNTQLEESVIVNCKGRSQEFAAKLSKEEINFVDIRSDLTDTNPVIILTDREVNLPFDQLTLTKSNVLQWYKYKVQPDSTEIFKCQLNAICAESGSGKTTLMKLLASKCPLNHWVVIIHLKEFRTFFKRNPSVSEILEQALPQQTRFISSLIKQLIDKRKVMFLFDGLDELNRDDVRSVTKTIKKLIREGYKIWVFATTNFRDVLEQLQIYSIYDIKILEKGEMQRYTTTRLQYQDVNPETVKYIADRIFDRSEPLEGTVDTMRTPLILFILTEVILAEVSRENNNLQQLDSYFVLTTMYRCFVDGKLKHNLAKKWQKKFEDIDEDLMGTEAEYVEYLLTEYSKAALKICLEPDVTRHLELKNSPTFLQTVRSNKDFLGIVTKVNTDDTLVFSHHTFAIYFSATWLAENHQAMNDRTFLFSPRHKLLRYFFNLKLAENCPLHVAVLQNDVRKVEALREQYGATVDDGGRTPLHLCVSAEDRCMFPQPPCNYCVNHQKILKLVSRQEHVRKADKLFGFTPLEYADRSLSLFSVEQLAQLTKLRPSDLSNHFELDRLNKLVDPVSYTAARSPYLNVLKTVIDNGMELDKGDDNRRTALHEAALYGRSTIAKLLIDAGANCEAKDIFGGTALPLAAKKGHLAVVKILVEHGADVNVTDDSGRSPLFEATYEGHSAIVEYLIENGANVDCRDSSHKTVLQKAVEKGHLEIVQMLLDSGTYINAVDKRQRTALHHASYEGHFDIVECLVEREVDVDLIDDDERTAQEVAAKRGHQHIVDVLKGVEKKVRRLQPPKTLHKAAQMGRVSEIERFLRKGTDIEELDDNNQTALHIASNAGHTQVVKFLLERDANTNARNSLGRIPLHLASQRGHIDIVELLLGKTEDCNVVDDEELTPLHLASFKGQTRTVKLLVESDADVNACGSSETPLFSASRGGHNDVIDFLIKEGASFDFRNRQNQSCLHVAAKAGHKKTVEYLITLNKNLLKLCDCEGRTALHWAAEKGHQDVMRVLEAAGVDKEAYDHYGRRASQIAYNGKRKRS